jgi:hypothetical protein
VHRYILLVHADLALTALHLGFRAGFEVLEEVGGRFQVIAVTVGALKLSVRALGCQVLDDIIIPKSLLLRGTHWTVEDYRGKFRLEHLVEFTEFGILFLALFVRTFPQGTLGPRTVNALHACCAIAALAFLCLLKYV